MTYRLAKTTKILHGIEWNRCEDKAPCCNSSILVTDGKSIWIADGFEEEQIEKYGITHWIDLIDLRPYYEKAVDSMPYRCCYKKD